jgi:hypothetical protein
VQAKQVRVRLLEEDNELQDKVLSAWHGVQLTLSQVAIGKIIENNLGRAWMISAGQSLQIALGVPSPPPSSAPARREAIPTTSRPAPGDRLPRSKRRRKK